MPDQHDEEIAQALSALDRGAPEAMQRLLPLVYRELKAIAHRQLRAEAGGHTLSTTAVVHEAYLRLAGEVLPDGTIECPWHGARFDCVTGELRRGPAEEGVPTFSVRVDGDSVLVWSRATE